ILSNHPGVHRGESGQMAELDGLSDGVVAREQDGERPTLGLQPVHGTEPLSHRVFLFGPLPLEAADVALELAYLVHRAPDACIEESDLLPLLGEPAIDGLQLGEQARLALARVRRFGPLLLEPLLRLLECLLLVAELPLVLLLSRRRQGDAQYHEGDERAPKRALPATARPRARRPPSPPRMAPPTIKSTIWGSEGNTARARPRVSWSRGSSLGAPTA